MEYIDVYPHQLTQTMSEQSSYILVLEAPTEHKQVPILIGESEAQAIIMAVEQRKARRPLTHNLLCNILEEFMLTLKEVYIERFEEGIFYSNLKMSDGFSDKLIDSRTSDAIVLALLQQAPVKMRRSVFEETYMEPGALSDNLPNNKAPEERQKQSLQELEELLRQCEENEDYEQAAEIMKKINKLKK